MFGTFREEFGVLVGITVTVSWKTREVLCSCFRKKNTIGRTIQFVPIKHVIYAKLMQANQSGLLTSNYQVSSLPVFSETIKGRFKNAFLEMADAWYKQTLSKLIKI